MDSVDEEKRKKAWPKNVIFTYADLYIRPIDDGPKIRP